MTLLSRAYCYISLFAIKYISRCNEQNEILNFPFSENIYVELYKLKTSHEDLQAEIERNALYDAVKKF